MKTLRPYQEEARIATHAKLAHAEREPAAIVILATGLGKTALAGRILQDRLSIGRGILVAHLNTLIEQGQSELRQWTELPIDREQAGWWADDHGSIHGAAPIVVATRQTLCAGWTNGRKRMERFTPSEFGTIVCDEAHHAASDQYRAIIRHFRQNPKLAAVGVTATPDRADERDIGEIYGPPVFQYELDAAVENGWLVNPLQRHLHLEGFDLSQLSGNKEDFTDREIAELFETKLAQNCNMVADATVRIVGEQKTLMFVPSIKAAELVAEMCSAGASGRARCVHSKQAKDTCERNIRDFRMGEFPYLVNVDVCSEGFNVPDIRVIVNARPTESRRRYAQTVGRGTRTLTGVLDGLDTREDRLAAIAASAKPHLLVLDAVGCAGKHSLVTVADLCGQQYENEVVEAVSRDLIESDDEEPKDVRALLEAKKEALDAKREADELRREEMERRAVRAKTFYVLSDPIDAFRILGRPAMPPRGWDEPPTPNMLRCLRNFKVPGPKRLTRRQAGDLCGTLIRRVKNNLCTLKQARVLKNRGFDVNVTIQEASRIIGGIAERENWKSRKPVGAASGNGTAS